MLFGCNFFYFFLLCGCGPYLYCSYGTGNLGFSLNYSTKFKLKLNIFCTYNFISSFCCAQAVLRIRDAYIGHRIRIFPSRIQDQNDPGCGSESLSKNVSIFMFSEKWSGMYIPDTESRFFPHPGSQIQWAKKIRIRNIGQSSCSDPC